MTIKVTVTNDDAVRHMEVTEIEYNRENGQKISGPSVMLKAGETRAFYIHALKDIYVREAHADLQARKA